jgi:hypothetical protein
VLEVVGDQQQPPAREMGPQRVLDRLVGPLLDPEHVGDRAGHERGILLGRQGGEVHAVVEAVRELRARLDREPRLAGPARAGQRDEAHAVAAQERDQLVELRAAADERRRGGGQMAAGAQLGRLDEQRRVLAQDRRLQLPQCRAGLHAELVDQRAPRAAVGVERVRLAAAAVEREHQRAPQPLPERLGGDQLLQLGEQLAVPAEREVGLEPVLDRGRPQLGEPARGRLGERLVGEVGERSAAPEPERVAQDRGRALGLPGGERLAALSREALEADGVDRLRRRVEHVAAGAHRDHGAVAEGGPQLRHVDLQPRERGGVERGPERLDQPVRRDGHAGLEREQRQQRALLAPSQANGLAVTGDLERPEDAELEPQSGATLSV